MATTPILHSPSPMSLPKHPGSLADDSSVPGELHMNDRVHMIRLGTEWILL